MTLGTQRLLGIAAVVVMMGGGIAMAGGESASLPLQGPIPFEVFDLDANGVISQQEFDQVRARRAQAREEAGLSPTRGSRSFVSLDGDADGEVTLEEFQAAHAAAGAGASQGPGNRGGRGRGRGGGPPTFSEFDLNGDGVIDEQEFIDARTKRIAERIREGRMMRGLTTPHTFADMDADGDGSLTPEEFGGAVRAHWQRIDRTVPPDPEP